MPVAQGPKGMKQEMGKFKSGTLHSGSASGPLVKSRKQAVAISLKESGQSNQLKSNGKARNSFSRGGGGY